MADPLDAALERMREGSAKIRAHTARIEASTAKLRRNMDRDRLIADVATKYGITLYRSRRHEHVVIASESDAQRLSEQVMHDPTIDAVGRGYYLTAFDMHTAPDWACDLLTLSMLRLRVHLIEKPMRRIIVGLQLGTRLHQLTHRG